LESSNGYPFWLRKPLESLNGYPFWLRKLLETSNGYPFWLRKHLETSNGYPFRPTKGLASSTQHENVTQADYFLIFAALNSPAPVDRLGGWLVIVLFVSRCQMTTPQIYNIILRKGI
jgi:hypothetical protein